MFGVTGSSMRHWGRRWSKKHLEETRIPYCLHPHVTVAYGAGNRSYPRLSSRDTAAVVSLQTHLFLDVLRALQKMLSISMQIENAFNFRQHLKTLSLTIPTASFSRRGWSWKPTRKSNGTLSWTCLKCTSTSLAQHQKVASIYPSFSSFSVNW